jgi:NADH-quinone oxidoreductase subunit J
VLGSGLKGIDSEGAPYVFGFGTPKQIGELLLTRFLFPFEAASFLLLVAAVGAVVLARRRVGIEGPAAGDTVSVADLFKPPPPSPGTLSDAPAESQLEHHGPAGR